MPVPPIVRRSIQAVLALLGIGLVAAGALVIWLAFPGAPATTADTRFVGFIGLPKGGGGLLSIMDYLTVDGRTLWATNESTGAVYRIPLGAGPLPASAAMFPGDGEAHGVAKDPASPVAFVTRSASDHVDAFDAASGVTLKHIHVDPDADGMIFDPADRLLYAVNGDPNLATLIDPATQAKAGTIALGGKPEFAVFDPQTGLIYQNLADLGVVAVVDVAHRAVLDRWPLKPCAGPTGAALDTADRRLFVVCGDALLVVLDLATHKVVASLPIGGGPDSVAYDAGLRRIYATGKSGVMSVIQQDSPDQYRTLSAIRLHYGAHTLAVDPLTHRVYVAYASLITAPRLAVFEPTAVIPQGAAGG